jgi:spore cortex biosynthesis protein YabQ
MTAFHYMIGLLACAWGMGAVFDFYNTVTGSTKWLRWIRPVLDVLFWVLSAGIVYYVAFITDNGALRIYTLVLLVLGYLLYRLFLHRIVVGGAYGVVRVIRAVAQFVIWIVVILVVRPIHVMLRIVWFILRRLYELGLWLENVLFAVTTFFARFFSYPIRRIWPSDAKSLQTITDLWEEFWTWLSNVIANRSERVE